MPLCTALYDNLLLDCDHLPPDKMGGDVYLINYDDILYVEFEGHEPSMMRTVAEHRDVVNLFLYPQTYAYKIEGKNGISVKSGYYQYELLYSDVYAHFVDLSISSSSISTKEQLEKLPKGKYCIIVESKRGNTVTREIYGLFTGLVLNENDRVVTNDDNSSRYIISFETDVEEAEPHMPHKILSTLSEDLFDWLTSDRWILWDGWWDDGGIWLDDETWNEG